MPVWRLCELVRLARNSWPIELSAGQVGRESFHRGPLIEDQIRYFPNAHREKARVTVGKQIAPGKQKNKGASL